MALGDKAPGGTLMKSHGDWRSSGLVGATVYNDQGDSIGTVNDLLVGSDGTVSNAVLSVGGFLGIGTKYVEVPFKSLKLVPSKSNPESGSKEATAGTGGASTMAPATTPVNATGTSGTAGAPAMAPGAAQPASTTMGAASTTPATAMPANAGNMAADHEYSLVLPGATKDSLTSDPDFKYED